MHSFYKYFYEINEIMDYERNQKDCIVHLYQLTLVENRF